MSAQFEEHEYDSDLIERPVYDDDEQISSAPAWLISMSVHALLLIILSVIIFGPYELDEPPTRQEWQAQQPLQIDPPEVTREIDPVDVKINVEEFDNVSVAVELNIEIEPIELSEEPVEAEVAPKGREEAVADAEAGGAMAFMAIGTSGGASGKIGSRFGGGKKRALRKGGGSVQSEKAVTSALKWFKRHQSENGQWDVDGYMDNCQDDPKCEPGTAHSAANGDGDTACTAYATLCFLGAGYEHLTRSTYQQTVFKAIEWLKKIQNEDGSFGTKKRNYENAVCTMALCEAYAMTMDRTLKEPAQRGIDFLLQRQAKSDAYPYGCGWNYTTANPQRNDASVSGWVVMALKAAQTGGLDTGDGWEGSRAYVEGAWQAANPNYAQFGSDSKSVFPYTFNQKAGTADKPRLAAVGAVCAVFQGHTRGDVMLDTLMNTIMADQVPKAYPCNTYYLYYNTLAAFQYGGGEWKVWNGTVRDMLVDAQHPAGSGCFSGSWDFEGTKFHGHDVGRLLSTAYCCLSLEVYYRYDRLMERRQKH